MDERKHSSRRKSRSRSAVRRRGAVDRPRRKPNGQEFDGNVTSRSDDVRVGKCSKCGGPAPDKANLCRHCNP